MHVIVLANELSSSRGGLELSLFDVCDGLARRGHSISLIYRKEGNLLKQYQDLCNNLVKINYYEINWRNIKCVLKFLIDIGKISANKNSVVYSSQYQDAFFGYTLALSKNVPFVSHLRLPPPDEFERHQWRIGLNGAKQFIAVSNQTKFEWAKSGFKEEKIDVVYNGIDLNLFKPLENFSISRKEWNIPEDIKIISYVGRLDRVKGVETLIRAFALLLESGISARLLVAGKPLWFLQEGEEYKKFLKQLSTDLGIEKYVDFLGHVANTISLYQVSDVTVLPSQWSEPFGRVIIESMACGTPVVASRIGGIPEILTGEFQSGLFEPGNEQDLSDTLSQIVNWRDSVPQLGQKCRDHVSSKFSLDKTVDGIEEVLLKVVKQ